MTPADLPQSGTDELIYFLEREMTRLIPLLNKVKEERVIFKGTAHDLSRLRVRAARTLGDLQDEAARRRKDTQVKYESSTWASEYIDVYNVLWEVAKKDDVIRHALDESGGEDSRLSSLEARIARIERELNL